MQRKITGYCLKVTMLLLVIGFCGFSEKLTAQETSSADYVPSNTYEKVLDKLFPRGSKRDFTDGREFAMSLRFASEELQINIVKLNDGEFSITSYELPANSPSIYEQTKQMLEKEKTLSVDTLASRIKIKTQNIRATPTIKKVISRFALLRLSPQLESGIILDATQYDFEYETFANKVHFELQTKRLKSDRNEHPLIKWMNELRNIVLKTTR